VVKAKDCVAALQRKIWRAQADRWEKDSSRIAMKNHDPDSQLGQSLLAGAAKESRASN